MSQTNMQAMILHKHETLASLLERQRKTLDILTHQRDALREFVETTRAMQELGK